MELQINRSSVLTGSVKDRHGHICRLTQIAVLHGSDGVVLHVLIRGLFVRMVVTADVVFYSVFGEQVRQLVDLLHRVVRSVGIVRVAFEHMRVGEDDDVAVSLFGFLLQEVLEPFELFTTKGSITRIDTDVEVFLALRRSDVKPIGARVEMRFVLGPLTKTQVVVTRRTEDRHMVVVQRLNMSVENRIVVLGIDDVAAEDHSSGGIAYVEGLAEKYDTYAKDRQFKTTKKGVITIKGGDKQGNDTGCYGWWIDQQKTMELIRDTIVSGGGKIQPVYYQNPDSKFIYACDESVWTKDKDYGNTYVEIDIAAQHMYYYADGKIAKEFDFVSGYLYDKNRYTREGVFKVWAKQSPSRLKGEGWDVQVQYWTNFSLYGAGFHDATWQYGVFGGNKYKTSSGGSHGCINLSVEDAKYVYNNIPINTPVFVYNIEKAAAGAATKPN